MVNRLGARVVFNKHWSDRSASPTAMLGQLGWSYLTERKRKASLVMTYRIKHGLVAIPGNRFAPRPDRPMRHDHDKKLELPGRAITLPKIHFLEVLCLTGMPSARKLSMPHHWRHLNTAWEHLSTAFLLPLAFMCPRALCKYTLSDLDFRFRFVFFLIFVQKYRNSTVYMLCASAPWFITIKTNDWVHAKTLSRKSRHTLITRFMGPTWGPSGADMTQAGPMLAPWSLLSGYIFQSHASLLLTCPFMLDVQFFRRSVQQEFRKGFLLQDCCMICRSPWPDNSAQAIPSTLFHGLRRTRLSQSDCDSAMETWPI